MALKRKFMVSLTKDFTITTPGDEKAAIQEAFADLIEGLQTGRFSKNDFRIESWEIK